MTKPESTARGNLYLQLELRSPSQRPMFCKFKTRWQKPMFCEFGSPRRDQCSANSRDSLARSNSRRTIRSENRRVQPPEGAGAVNEQPGASSGQLRPQRRHRRCGPVPVTWQPRNRLRGRAGPGRGRAWGRGRAGPGRGRGGGAGRASVPPRSRLAALSSRPRAAPGPARSPPVPALVPPRSPGTAGAILSRARNGTAPAAALDIAGASAPAPAAPPQREQPGSHSSCSAHSARGTQPAAGPGRWRSASRSS